MDDRADGPLKWRRLHGMTSKTTRKPTRLYRYIEHLQGHHSWGAVLDAGTGVNSARWMTGLETERWTAVSGSSRHAERVRDAVQTVQRADDRIIVGNWADPQFLKDEVYDTVIADYLLGALEGFAPYFQPYLFTRLRPLVQKTLYVTGLEPYVPTTRPETKAGRIVWDIGRFRDACVLLAGGLPYREYPSQWAGDQLQRAGFTVQHLKHFDISYKALFVNAQIDIALSGLDELPDRTLAKSLKARGEALRAEALDMIRTEGALRACRNYVFSAKPL